MCGRFQMSDDTLGALSVIARIPRAIQGELNLGMIFPSQSSLVLVDRAGQLYGTQMKFGFESASMKKRLINVRSETVLEKPMFSRAIRYQRCIVPCSRFYEWDAQKQMIDFYGSDPAPLYMAGIYMEGQFMILTTQANETVAPYHHRMPLIFDEQQARQWVLDPQSVPSLLKVRPAPLEHSFVNQQPRLF